MSTISFFVIITILFVCCYCCHSETITTTTTTSSSSSSSSDPVSYGVDISWPMHHGNVSVNYPWLLHNMDPKNHPIPDEYKGMKVQPLGNVQERYEHYMNGCTKKYSDARYRIGTNRCRINEQDRWEMSFRQPQSMKNYTQLGFTKIRSPTKVFELLKSFWDANQQYQKAERWTPGNIYTNHWDSPSYMLSVEDTSLQGGGDVIKGKIWDAARDTMENWTGYKQAECSLYGIRIYKTGAMLAPHVDRLPLVCSAIINVAQDVDEPWPLEVIGHDGIAYNVTMEPGDMVLYESHSIIHGRQFPLKGRFMANVFIHFEPVGPIGGQVEYTGDLPPYIIPGSLEEVHWRENNPNGHQYLKARYTPGTTELHQLATTGNVQEMERLLEQHGNELVHVRDTNGWTPLHEAVRKGSIRSIELLLNRGAEINARVGTNGQGGSVMWLAKNIHGPNHTIVRLLKNHGAKEYRPEL